MKKLLLFSLAMFLLLPLTGLFAEGQKEGKSAVKELIIWKWGDPSEFGQGIEEAAWPVIEKELGIKIKTEYFPGISEPEYVIKVSNAIKFGKGPDMMDGNGLILGDLAYQGFCEPIPSQLDKKLQGTLIPSYAKVNYLWQKDGSKVPIWGAMTGSAGGQTVFWNTKMYKEAGLTRSMLTWDETFEFGQKLTKKDADGNIIRSGFFLRTGGHVGGIGDKWYPYFLSAGGGSMFELDSAGHIKAKLNTDAGRASVQFYMDALYKYKIDAMGIPGDVGGWEKGQTATVSSRRSWVPNDVKTKAPEMYQYLAAGPIPVRKKGMKSITTSHTYGIAVNPKISKAKKEAVWSVLSRLNDDDLIKARTNDIGVWLPTKASVGKPPFDEMVWKQYMDANAYVINRVEGPRFATAYNVIGEQLNLIFAKELTIEQGLDAASAKLNEMFEGVVLKN